MIYINKYIGIYRIKTERDIKTRKPLESTYLVCQRDIQIYRVGAEILALYCPRLLQKTNTIDRLNGIELIDYFNTDKETIIKFYEKDLEKILEVFKPVIRGKDIKPRNKYKSKLKKIEDYTIVNNQIL